MHLRHALDRDAFPRTTAHRQSGVAIPALHALAIHLEALAAEHPIKQR